MSTDYLHRPMADAIAEIGERVEPQIDALFHQAFDQAMAIDGLGDQLKHDALSLMFQLSAVMAAKATILLGQSYPEALPGQIWQTAMTDLQMRVQQAMAILQADTLEAGRTVQ